MATTGDCLGYLVIVETHCQKDKTTAYVEELLLLMEAPQLCHPWKLFADYFAQNFTRIFKLHCAKSRSSNEDPEHNSVVPFVLVNKACEYAGHHS